MSVLAKALLVDLWEQVVWCVVRGCLVQAVGTPSHQTNQNNGGGSSAGALEKKGGFHRVSSATVEWHLVTQNCIHLKDKRRYWTAK